VLWGSEDDGEFISPPPWCAADLCSIVSYCPRLFEVRTDRLQPGLHVSELHKLTALTHIQLSYYYIESLDKFAGCVPGLSAVTQLHSLLLAANIPAVTASCLLPLTSLAVLTRFDCSWHYGSAVCLFTQVNLPSRDRATAVIAVCSW
jgi:hypothetical protein